MGLKLCIFDGCFSPTLGSRCAEHERQHQAERNRLPGRQPRRTRAYMETPIPVGSMCWCCGSTQDLTRHHANPLARRPDASSLLVPMCRSCNSSIGAKHMAGLACPLHGGEEA